MKLWAVLCLTPDLLQALAEILVNEDFEGAVQILNEGCIGFHPVTGIQVVDIIDILVLRRVDVPTNEARAVVLFGESLDQVLKAADVINHRFSVGLDRL